MNGESPLKALSIVLAVVLVASFLVSATVVTLRPLQVSQKMLERSRNIVALTGLLALSGEPTREDMLRIYSTLDARTLDLETAGFNPHIDPHLFDQRQAVNDPELGVGVPAEYDSAGLSRRSRYVPVYLVWKGDELDRIILPVNGKGMWSMLYGYVALQADFSTIADATIYEQNETPGLGDQVARPDWLAKWRGRKIYDEKGEFRFAVAKGRVDSDASAAPYHVDALTGASVTADAVSSLMQYWFGPHGYRPFLDHLRNHRPIKEVR